MPGVPTLEQVRAYLGVGVDQLPDEQLARIYGAEIEEQAQLCRETDDPATLPDPLAQAIMRRCQRTVASKALPLGLIGPEGGDFGPANIPFFDAEIEKAERGYRRLVLG